MSDAPQKPKDNGRRDALGRFGAGNNANPGGKTPLPPELKEKGADLWRVQLRLALEGVIARKNSEGVEVLIEVDAELQAKTGDKLLDRLHGKPTQSHEIKEAGGLLRELLGRDAPPVPDHLDPSKDEEA